MKLQGQNQFLPRTEQNLMNNPPVMGQSTIEQLLPGSAPVAACPTALEFKKLLGSIKSIVGLARWTDAKKAILASGKQPTVGSILCGIMSRIQQEATTDNGTMIWGELKVCLCTFEKNKLLDGIKTVVGLPRWTDVLKWTANNNQPTIGDFLKRLRTELMQADENEIWQKINNRFDAFSKRYGNETIKAAIRLTACALGIPQGTAGQERETTASLALESGNQGQDVEGEYDELLCIWEERAGLGQGGNKVPETNGTVIIQGPGEEEPAQPGDDLLEKRDMASGFVSADSNEAQMARKTTRDVHPLRAELKGLTEPAPKKAKVSVGAFLAQVAPVPRTAVINLMTPEAQMKSSNVAKNWHHRKAVEGRRMLPVQPIHSPSLHGGRNLLSPSHDGSLQTTTVEHVNAEEARPTKGTDEDEPLPEGEDSRRGAPTAIFSIPFPNRSQAVVDPNSPGVNSRRCGAIGQRGPCHRWGPQRACPYHSNKDGSKIQENPNCAGYVLGGAAPAAQPREPAGGGGILHGAATAAVSDTMHDSYHGESSTVPGIWGTCPYPSPDTTNQAPFTAEEDSGVLNAVLDLGQDWDNIASTFQRTPSAVQTRYRYLISRQNAPVPVD